VTSPVRTVVILEDEAPARARLEEALGRVVPDAVVVAALDSVVRGEAWLVANPHPDVLLADIQLADGLSFELFERVELACPVVFCTAYDEYAIEAMTAGGIDYLLKPIHDADLQRALARYTKLEAHFRERVRNIARSISRPPRRLLVRRRDSFVALEIAHVAYFAVDDKLVDVITRDGQRYGIDRTLAELEAELDPADFFRVNRQYLVAAGAVTGFRSFVKGKLLVELEPAPTAEVIVSQENAARFRSWLRG
jgi:DNA-binding LytR/AlgR family response regulator